MACHWPKSLVDIAVFQKKNSRDSPRSGVKPLSQKPVPLHPGLRCPPKRFRKKGAGGEEEGRAPRGAECSVWIRSGYDSEGNYQFEVPAC